MLRTGAILSGLKTLITLQAVVVTCHFPCYQTAVSLNQLCPTAVRCSVHWAIHTLTVSYRHTLTWLSCRLKTCTPELQSSLIWPDLLCVGYWGHRTSMLGPQDDEGKAHTCRHTLPACCRHSTAGVFEHWHTGTGWWGAQCVSGVVLANDIYCLMCWIAYDCMHYVDSVCCLIQPGDVMIELVGNNFKSVIFRSIIQNSCLSTHCEITQLNATRPHW